MSNPLAQNSNKAVSGTTSEAYARLYYQYGPVKLPSAGLYLHVTLLFMVLINFLMSFEIKKLIFATDCCQGPYCVHHQ